ncbi:MAG: GxxExxY protein [Planctomycetota bacterium]
MVAHLGASIAAFAIPGFGIPAILCDYGNLNKRNNAKISPQRHEDTKMNRLESVYEVCLCHELKKRGVPFRSQVILPVIYDGVNLEAGLRLDLLVAEALIVELKAVERMLPLFDAQLLTYLKLTNLRLGLLINFNVPVIREGIKRIIC